TAPRPGSKIELAVLDPLDKLRPRLIAYRQRRAGHTLGVTYGCDARKVGGNFHAVAAVRGAAAFPPYGARQVQVVCIHRTSSYCRRSSMVFLIKRTVSRGLSAAART